MGTTKGFSRRLSFSPEYQTLERAVREGNDLLADECVALITVQLNDYARNRLSQIMSYDMTHPMPVLQIVITDAHPRKRYYARKFISALDRHVGEYLPAFYAKLGHGILN